ncbi:protein-tyrosine-phosphatase MKP1-like [Typha latifolia]|uniref:protein-tyrosine-phosphatase MKP1-like n=1 Tax=Typha latifolia TaxID=4733 RepID=UPI003C2B4027
MDSSDSTPTATPRKSLWRSASWTGRSSPSSNPNPNPNPVRSTRRPAHLALPTRPPLSGWPIPALDDGTCPTPSASLSRVADHVFIGSEAAARDRAVLRRHGITHVLNCVGDSCPDYFRGDGDLVYQTLWLHDSPGEDLAAVLYDAFDFLESAAAAPGGRALVHCVRGKSRSAAVVVAYLMWHDGVPFDAALRRVRAARAAVDPNLGFAAQLLRRQPRGSGGAIPASPGSARRVLRLAPHSPYAPLYLVPKAVVGGGAEFLDSRGAFIVHAADAVYVWIGASCEPAMAAAAERAARQVARYERAVGPLVTFQEGSEPDNFWAAVAEDSTIPDACPEAGKRRVELYDLDFEIFYHGLKSPSRSVESPESTTPSSSSSSSFAFSPASSSSSDWYNLPSTPGSSPQSDTKVPPLSPRNEKDPTFTPISTTSERTRTLSLAQRRGGIAPSLDVSSTTDDEKAQLSDWCASPPFIPEVDMCRLSLDSSEHLEVEEEENELRDEDSGLIHPILFRWPEMDKLEEIHPGVLDSRLILLMLAPEDLRKSARKQNAKILYLWLGSRSKLSEGDRDACLKKIGVEFFDQMDLPRDTPLEIIKEGQEPQQFLNHLFSFR